MSRTGLVVLWGLSNDGKFEEQLLLSGENWRLPEGEGGKMGVNEKFIAFIPRAGMRRFEAAGSPVSRQTLSFNEITGKLRVTRNFREPCRRSTGRGFFSSSFNGSRLNCR